MALATYMGIETEFGISVVGQPRFDPVVSSAMVINAYNVERRSNPAWDYHDETPFNDARNPSFSDLSPTGVFRSGHVPNMILSNGARLYVDHAHPEYATPEVTNPRDAVIWDKAGEVIMNLAARRAAQLISEETGGPSRIVITKNNTDGKGSAYGTHENYLVSRDVPFCDLVRQLTPLFVSRQPLTGAGRIGNEHQDGSVPFQITQRADFFESEVGVETTFNRPIINTRDEPHADPERYRRLHVIVGDANMSEVATFLKTGMTALVLATIEDRALPSPPMLADPVAALRAVSHDVSCRRTIELLDGTQVTAMNLQHHFLEAVQRWASSHDRPPWADDVITLWGRLIDAIETDPDQLVGTVDWVTKRALMRRYMDRDGVAWADPKLKLIDIQYHDVDPERGLYNTLAVAGRCERIVDDAEIVRAVNDPPRDTRAYFRGRCVDKFGADIAASGWDSMVFDTGETSLQRVLMMEPGRGTEPLVGELLDNAESTATLVEKLQG